MIKGDKLRKLRHDKGISADMAATDLKMGKAQLLKYENEKTEPTTGILLRLMDYYGVSADYLLGRTELLRPSILTVNIRVPEVLQTMGLEKGIPWLKKLGIPITVLPVDVAELLHMFPPETVGTLLKELGLHSEVGDDGGEPEVPE